MVKDLHIVETKEFAGNPWITTEVLNTKMKSKKHEGQVSTKASRQSTLGYTHGSSLSVDGAQATNSMVMQDTDKLFIQVRPPCGRNTYVLRLVVLICVERIMCMTCPLGDPCPSLYIVKGQSYK